MPDCDISVATLHNVFLPEESGSVCFFSEKVLGTRDGYTGVSGATPCLATAGCQGARDDFEMNIPPRCVKD